MPDPTERMRSLLRIEETARRTAKEESIRLFGLLKRAVESSIPCKVVLQDHSMTQDLGIEMKIECQFDTYGSLMEYEQLLGDHLEDTSRHLLGWSRSPGEYYGWAATLLF